MKYALEDVGLTHAAHFVVNISALVFVASVALLYFGKQLTTEDQKLLFFNFEKFTADITTFQSPPPSVAISLNDDTPVVRKEVQDEEFVNAVPNADNGIPLMTWKQQPLVERLGVVDENGVMSNEFRVGDFGNEIAEILSSINSGSVGVELVDVKGIGVGGTSFPQCPANMTDYVPCLDNVDERDCPEKGKGLDCLIPR